MKKFVEMLLTLVVVCSVSMVPYGSVNAQEVASDGTLLTQDLESTMEALSLTRGIYLWSCSASITSPGTGLTCSTGKTYATKVVPSLYVAVHLQQYSGSTWTTVANWTQYAYNDSIVTSSKTYSVTRGYYYRTATVHNAYGETGAAITNGIYIS